MNSKMISKSISLLSLLCILGLLFHSCAKDSIIESPVDGLSIVKQVDGVQAEAGPQWSCNGSPCTSQEVGVNCDCPRVCNCSVTMTVSDLPPNSGQVVYMQMYLSGTQITTTGVCFSVSGNGSETFDLDGGNVSQTKYKLQVSQATSNPTVVLSGQCLGAPLTFENMSSNNPVDVCLGHGCRD